MKVGQFVVRTDRHIPPGEVHIVTGARVEATITPIVGGYSIQVRGLMPGIPPREELSDDALWNYYGERRESPPSCDTTGPLTRHHWNVFADGEYCICKARVVTDHGNGYLRVEDAIALPPLLRRAKALIAQLAPAAVRMGQKLDTAMMAESRVLKELPLEPADILRSGSTTFLTDTTRQPWSLTLLNGDFEELYYTVDFRV